MLQILLEHTAWDHPGCSDAPEISCTVMVVCVVATVVGERMWLEGEGVASHPSHPLDQPMPAVKLVELTLSFS